jgi:ABC-type nickel/cobalt efflux system permease component RcnA
VLPVTVGTVLWAVALVVLLPFRSRLRADGTDWWIWVCVTGVLLGLAGSWWVRRRRAAYRRTLRRRDPDPR